MSSFWLSIEYFGSVKYEIIRRISILEDAPHLQLAAMRVMARKVASTPRTYDAQHILTWTTKRAALLTA